jgi:diacylglycerol O-acyltransferase / wax synthase
MSNVLGLFDQAFFTGERVTGATGLLQCVWVYDRAIDINGLRRFHHHLQRGRLSRRIERSPLPFARYRWVSAGGQTDLEIVETPRPREEFDAWLAEQASTPVDAEHGPEWHLAVLPFTDGGAGVSLLISHSLTDGVGLCQALADAATGRDDPINWPAAGSRPRWRAIREDARQTMRDIPGIGRAVVTASRMARRSVGDRAASTSSVPTGAPAPLAGADEQITLAKATTFVDADAWDASAGSLGGTSNSLLAAVAARLAQRAGRVAADGSVTVGMPVNERTADDTRANAVTNVDFTVDPAFAMTDLREIRSATKQAILRRDENPDERWVLLPLVPLIPQWLLKRMAGVAAGSATGVVASNLGEVNPAAYRLDGTAADSFAIKSSCPGMTKALMHRAGGMMAMLYGRAGRQVFVSVAAYQPGGANSDADLQRDLASALGDFALTGSVGWPSAAPVAGAR